MVRHKKSSRLQWLKILLAVSWLLLAALHIIALYLSYNTNGSLQDEISRLFDLDSERNIPTVYSGLLWGTGAFMAALLASRAEKRSIRWRWIVLAALFLYLAFDEILIVHERIAEPIRDFLNIGDGSPFYHAWILAAMLVMGVLGIMYLFIKERDTISHEQRSIFRLLLMLAGGVVLLEAVGTQVYVSGLIYRLGPVMIEELFEIAMISTLLYRLTYKVIIERR